MRQYRSIKMRYKDCILFFRVGDFYETFEEDAKIVSDELKIVLTSRDNVPLAGIPHHALYSYVGKLLEKGYKVAICEQLEDPKKAKGLVRRGVTRILTPGTIYEEELVKEKVTNYLCTVIKSDAGYGLAAADISTGEFFTAFFDGEDSRNRLEGELLRLSPSEIVCDSEEVEKYLRKVLDTYIHVTKYSKEECIDVIKEHFEVEGDQILQSLSTEEMIRAVGTLLNYVKQVHSSILRNLKNVRILKDSSYMILDSTTLKNLEIFRSLRGDRKGTLLSILDKCVTSQGSRSLHRLLRRPLLDIKEINTRLDCVEELIENVLVRKEIVDVLKKMVDFERVATRIICENANPKEIVMLGKSLECLDRLATITKELKNELFKEFTSELSRELWKEIATFIRNSIEEEPGNVGDGTVIRKGFDEEFDRYREALREGQKWIAEIERKERLRTGIKSLKIGYNNIIGYYIEVSMANIHRVPKDYIRKQTLKNAERFTTPELQEKEYLIKSSEERIVNLEKELYSKILRELSKYAEDLKKLGKIIGELDVFVTFAEISSKNQYVRPIVDDSMIIEIKDSRHPVLEVFQGDFVPNDVYLDGDSHRFIILTGPNMAGKSTYMRQIALTVILAQIGCFVPASSARIGIVDRIYTRVGASDDIIRGQSTFTTEMIEVANILNTSTKRSLILLDEIGRGTSTFDGLSIAWSVVEYIHNRIGARTIFATHYHQLSELEKLYEGIKNYHIEVREDPEGLVFVRKIKRGPINKSYGVEVAKLAGLPKEVIERAKEILKKVEEDGENVFRKPDKRYKQMALTMYNIFEENKILEEIKNLDVSQLTPIEALNKLYEIQRKIYNSKR